MTEGELKSCVDRLLNSQATTDKSIRVLSDGVSGLTASIRSVEARVDSLHDDVTKTRDVTIATAAKLEAHQDVHHVLNDRLREMRTEHDEDITGIVDLATRRKDSSDKHKKPSLPPQTSMMGKIVQYKELLTILIAFALVIVWFFTGQTPEETVARVRDAAEEAKYQASESKKAANDVVKTVEDLAYELESLKQAVERRSGGRDG